MIFFSAIKKGKSYIVQEMYDPGDNHINPNQACLKKTKIMVFFLFCGLFIYR